MKRIIILAAALFIHVDMIYGQSLAVTGSAIIANPDPCLQATAHLTVKNTSLDTLNILCEKIIIDTTAGTSNFFCWGANCYGSETYISSSYNTLDPGEGDNVDFGGYYDAYCDLATATIEYCFYPDTDPNDRTCITILYNGNISSISYHKDTENGLELIKQEVFHFTGGKSMVGTFEGGLREGIWTFYYENGLKRLEGTYRSGQKDSLWTYWYDNGVKATEYFYDNKTFDGKIMEWHIDKECWDRDGNECECGQNWWSECEIY